MPHTRLFTRPFVEVMVFSRDHDPEPMKVHFASLEGAQRHARRNGLTVQWGLLACRDGRIWRLSDHPTLDEAEAEADRIEESQSLPDGLTAADLIGGEN